MDKAFHDGLREYSELCTRSLAGDAQLRRRVELELLDHLEEAFAEERAKETDEQALKNAVRRFGDPGELSDRLAESNAARLSRYARIRRMAKWLFIPVLVAGVLLCIDLRGIMSGVALLNVLKPIRARGSGDDLGWDWERGLKTRKLSKEERLLFDYYYGRGDRIELLSRLHDAHGGDPLFCALYAQELSLAADKIPNGKERLAAAIADGGKVDPSNPLYDYLECLMIMKEACILPRVGADPAGDDAIRDRGKLERAITAYRRGLSKGRIRTYGPELFARIRGMLEIEKDLLGGLHLLDAASRERLLFLSVLRSIARGVVLYCDLLHREGRRDKAVELLATWRTFIPQYLDGTGAHLVDILGCLRVAEDCLKCAERLGSEEEIAALQSLADIRREMRVSTRDFVFHREGGLLATLVAPFSAGGDDVAEWSVERRLEAAALDATSLGIACLVLILAIAGFGLHALVMRLSGRHTFLFIMPKRAYLKLFLAGILLPASIYFAISYFAAGKGGAWGIAVQSFPAIYLCLLWPLCYAAYACRMLKTWMASVGAEDHDAFGASLSLNMLCLLTLLLVAAGGVLRPVSNLRQSYYAGRETLVIPRDGVDTHEQRSIRVWRSLVLERCRKVSARQVVSR